MSFQGNVEIRCPECGEVFESPVWSFIHGQVDISLRDQIKARECNLLLCPQCEKAFIPNVSWIYYEPNAEIIAFVFPESWKVEEAKWREKMKTDFSEMKKTLGPNLPVDIEPMIFFGQDKLADLLEQEDWSTDETDVMEFFAKDLGLSVYKARPTWARENGHPREYPYVGQKAPTRDSLITGIKTLLKANDRLTAWADFLKSFESNTKAQLPPAAKSCEN